MGTNPTETQVNSSAVDWVQLQACVYFGLSVITSRANRFRFAVGKNERKNVNNSVSEWKKIL